MGWLAFRIRWVLEKKKKRESHASLVTQRATTLYFQQTLPFHLLLSFWSGMLQKTFYQKAEPVLQCMWFFPAVPFKYWIAANSL